MDLLNYFHDRNVGFDGWGKSRNRSLSFRTPQVDSDFLLTKLRCNWKDDHLTIGTRESDDDMDQEYMIPAFACKFNQTARNQHILAFANEDGIINILDTNRHGDATYLQSLSTHENAVFDFCWVPECYKIVTGSGDKTACLWDVEREIKLSTFSGHNGSVKAVEFAPMDQNVFATGSRDGCIMIWDARSYSKDGIHSADDTIPNSHTQFKIRPCGKRKAKESKTCQFVQTEEGKGVTSVIFQNEHTLISAGSVYGEIKVWDLRKHYSTCKNIPIPKFVFKTKTGFTSLIFDSSRMRLFASSYDNTIYQFDCASFCNEPIATYKGHHNRSAFVKSALSPDDQYLLSGSGDHNAYIWKTSEPGLPIIKLEGHRNEVTAVAWSPEPTPKIATCGDDMKFKLWRPHLHEEMTSPEHHPPAGTAEVIQQKTLHRSARNLKTPPYRPTSARRLFPDPQPEFKTPTTNAISTPTKRTPTKRTPKKHDQENAHRSPSAGKKSLSPKLILSPSKAVRNEENIRRKLAFECNLFGEKFNSSPDSAYWSTPGRTPNPSPTVNLPNFAVDGMTTPVSSSSGVKRKRQIDWLTQIGEKEKQKGNTPQEKRDTPQRKRVKGREVMRKSTKAKKGLKMTTNLMSPITAYFSSLSHSN